MTTTSWAISRSRRTARPRPSSCASSSETRRWVRISGSPAARSYSTSRSSTGRGENMAFPLALGIAAGASALGGLLTKKPKMPGLTPMPGSNLPGVMDSMRLLCDFRQRGVDLFGRPMGQEYSQQNMAPAIDAELMRMRENARMTKGSLAGDAERRGLTFSDIALGNIGRVDAAANQAEADIRSRYSLAAMDAMNQERRQREQSELGFYGDQIGLLQQLGLLRDQADQNRALSDNQLLMARYGIQSGNANATQGGLFNLAGTLAGLGLGANKWGVQAMPDYSSKIGRASAR